MGKLGGSHSLEIVRDTDHRLRRIVVVSNPRVKGKFYHLPVDGPVLTESGRHGRRMEQERSGLNWWHEESFQTSSGTHLGVRFGFASRLERHCSLKRTRRASFRSSHSTLKNVLTLQSLAVGLGDSELNVDSVERHDYGGHVRPHNWSHSHRVGCERRASPITTNSTQSQLRF